MQENQTKSFAQLHWACRRGMLELDLILGSFLASGYPFLSDSEKALFDELLSREDTELFQWFFHRDEPVPEHFATLVHHILKSRST